MPEPLVAQRRLVHCRRPAMATWFEIWLSGDDEEHLAAVGEAALDEVQRVEQLLSRFDPAAELARVNREAAHRPVLVDAELFAVLADCARWHELTGGYFDVWATGARMNSQVAEVVRLPNALAERKSHDFRYELDAQRRTVQFLDSNVAVDLGGYGKGYALDAAAQVLDRFGVRDALLHGGTSSVLARGERDEESPWLVGLRDPFADADNAELDRLPLHYCGFSSSAVFGEQGEQSDIVVPHSGRELAQQAACIVVAPTALQAEVLSTALLAMGHAAAEEFWTRSPLSASSRAAWISRRGDRTVLEWLNGGRDG